MNRRRAWVTRLACAVGWLSLLAGCDPTGRARANPPTRAADRPRRGAGLGIPYPVSEPVKTEGWSRALLARSDFVALTQPHEQAEPVRLLGPSYAATGPDEAQYEALVRLAFGSRAPRQPSAKRVDGRRLAAAGVRPPAPSVFLVGATGNCRAQVGEARVRSYTADAAVVQVDWDLDGCDPDAAWGPVGILGDRLPQDTMWIAADVGLDLAVPTDTGWSGPLANAVSAPRFADGQDAPLQVVRVLQIPGATPTVVQVYDSLVRPADPEAYPPLVAQALDPACADTHATAIAYGFWNGVALEPFEPTAAESEPHLLGAFVRGAQIDGLVYDDRLDLLVTIPPAPTLDGESPWVNRALPTAHHSAYARASWGYLPTSGISPRGQPCQPPPG